MEERGETQREMDSVERNEAYLCTTSFLKVSPEYEDAPENWQIN